MPIWGKILGTIFGFMFRGVTGAVIGFIVGHFFDRGYSRDFNQMGGFSQYFTSKDDLKSQAIFFHALFSVMGHVAKADGRVTNHEIKMATLLMDQMDLTGSVRQEAQQAFREGKDADFPLKEVLKEFYHSCHGRRDVMQVYLEILIQAAFADGHIAQQEYKVLANVASQLGFKQRDLDGLLAMYEAELKFRGQQGSQRRKTNGNGPTQGQTLENSAKVLGVNVSDDAATIKKAYRRLMAQHHPDKLMSKGLPKQALEIAKGKTQDIQSAYEIIKQHKGFK